MKTIRLLLALLALATGAFAQDNNAVRLALAREAVGAMQADKLFDSIMAQMKQMTAQLANEALPPEVTPELRAKFEAFQTKVMDISMESARGMLAQMDQLYADIYSEAELKAIVAFFKSPEGQSMLAKQPQVMQRVMTQVQASQRELMPRVQQLTKEFEAEIAAMTKAPEKPAAR